MAEQNAEIRHEVDETLPSYVKRLKPAIEMPKPVATPTYDSKIGLKKIFPVRPTGMTPEEEDFLVRAAESVGNIFPKYFFLY